MKINNVHSDRTGTITQHCYWECPPVVPKEQSIADFIEETRAVMKAAVKRHLNGADNMALFLSGGLDKSNKLFIPV